MEVPLVQCVLRVDEGDASGKCVVRCPSCSERLTKEASDAMMTALVAVGVEISLAITDVADPVPSDPLTFAEIEEFVSQLQAESDLLRYVHRD